MIYSIENDNIKLVVDSKGAEATHLECNGINYLRERDEVWNSTAPILFPIVGRFLDKYTYINGVKYEMGTHGLLRLHDFKLFKKTENKITFKDTYNEESLKCYPFKYEAYVSYELNGKNVKTTIIIKNVDDKVFAYNIGGHPGFKCPIYEKENFEDYRIQFNENETFAAPSVVNGMLDFEHPFVKFDNIDHIDLNYDYFEVDAIVNKNIKSDKVSLLNKNNKGISMTWSGFNTMAFWTIPKNKYLCFEPWKGYADEPKTKHDFYAKADLIYIKPNETKEVFYNIEILE